MLCSHAVGLGFLLIAARTSGWKCQSEALPAKLTGHSVSLEMSNRLRESILQQRFTVINPRLRSCHPDLADAHRSARLALRCAGERPTLIDAADDE
jgi:hypothetical protein